MILLQIPPLPTPIPLPGPGERLDISPIWDIDNVSGMLSALQTMVVLANQNKIMNIAIILGVIVLVTTFMLRLATPSSSGGTDSNDDTV